MQTKILTDMEDVMAETLNIIHNEGESFSQRAEMYYRKRPQLVGYVEEVFRSYRALAERYDLLSKELQSANHTIAIVFPEQVHIELMRMMLKKVSLEQIHHLKIPTIKHQNQAFLKLQISQIRTLEVHQCCFLGRVHLGGFLALQNPLPQVLVQV